MIPIAATNTRFERSGLTLIELLIVLALVGILVGLASTGWQRVMWRAKAYGSAQEFRNALLLARSDAISRKHHSGVFFDQAHQRYLRFLDSTGNDKHNGRYSPGERIIQDWTPLPKELLISDVTSPISPDPVPRPCNGAKATTTITQTGTFSVVFYPDGRSWTTFQAKISIASFPSDTFRIGVLPSTGLVTMEH